MAQITIKQDSSYTLNISKTTKTVILGVNTDIDVTTAKQAGLFADDDINWNVTNNGTISGSSAVAFNSTGSATGIVTFTNGVNGKIDNATGTYGCVYIKGEGIVTNEGSIDGSGPQTDGFGGIWLQGGGSIDNASTGHIVGNIGLAAAGTITNAGYITNTGINTSTVYIGVATDKVTNSGKINVTGGFASDIYAKLGGTVTNTGTITGSAYHLAAINMAEGGNVTNSGQITLSSTDHNAGIQLKDGGTATNSGKISITVSGGHAAGIQLDAQGAATNSGTISVTGEHLNGILLENAGTAKNSGTIKIASSSTVATSYGTGIYSDLNSDITNTGVINVSGTEHLGGVTLKSNGSVINSGSIDVTVSQSHAVGVKLAAGGSITNSGSIDVTAPQTASGVYMNGGALDNKKGGSISCAGNAGVYVGGTVAATITNAGTISGASSVVFANASGSATPLLNVLTLQTGSDLVGIAKGSTGTAVSNDLIFTGHGTANNAFENFQQLTVDTGAAWTIAGAAQIANTIVEGSLTVSAKGSLSGTLSLASGVAIFKSAYDEDIGFVGAAELELTQDDYSGQISGWGAGDKVDFLALNYATTDKLALSGAQLDIETMGGKTLGYFTLDSSSYSLSDFKLGEDAAGHILVSGKSSA